MKDFLQKTLLKIVTFGARKIAKVKAPWTHKGVKAEHYHQLRKVIKPGMVLLSRTDGEFSNLFIPGEFSHSAFVKNDLRCVEAVSKSVSDTDLIDFMLTKDRVVCLAPKFADEGQMQDAAVLAETFLGSPYDYSMEYSDIKAFFCSELIYYCYETVLKNSPFKLRNIFGVSTVAPSDFWQATAKFTVVWDSNNTKI